MAQVGACEIFEPRSALAAAASVAGAVSIVITSFDVIRKARCSCSRSDILEMPGRRASFQSRAGKHARLANTAALPIGIENLVEALPIRVRRAKKRPERGFQRG